jgi:hypothetical protein
LDSCKTLLPHFRFKRYHIDKPRFLRVNLWLTNFPHAFVCAYRFAVKGEKALISVIDQNDASTWLGDAVSPVDAIALLSPILASAWEVVREVDPAGEVSIVAFSTADDLAMPTFSLFEKGGQAVVATIRDDVWESEQGFASYRQAVSTILAEAMRVDATPHGPGPSLPAQATGSSALER